MSEEKNTYTIHEQVNMGEVQIADEVITIIAGLAATEVEGVASMAGNITYEVVSKLGMKNLSKGVKITVADGAVFVDLTLVMNYGYSIPKTCAKVQERVQNMIENMTGMSVSEVNIHVAGVAMK